MSVIDVSRLSGHAVITRSSDSRRGTASLDAVEAAAHPERLGSNADVVAKQVSAAGALLRRLLETLSLILLAAGIALAARSSW